MLKKYFDDIDQKLKTAYKTAKDARKKGHDPEMEVEIPLVYNMAERVEGLISVAAPQIIGSGVSKRIKNLEKKFGSLDWRIALTIAEEIADEKFCKFPSKHEAMVVGIRVGIAYITMGTVSSPLEGFVDLKVKKRSDGKEYLAIFFSGPIRSAGGTAASVSVIIADYIRKKMGYAPYDPTEEEIKRVVTELYDYHERITNLQYLPSEAEIEFLMKNIPMQIDGDPSEKIEVSNYKDLPRIETNLIRNGVCLVLGEGIAQKAPKLVKQLSSWGKDFDLGQWNFLENFVELQKHIKAGKDSQDESKEKIKPDYTFIKDLVAGRPVLTHPLGAGGFRLRYGRNRVNGYSAVSIHPASMLISQRYLATGTQLKVERPGKAAVITSCDTIEGPIVKIDSGDVIQLKTSADAKQYAKDIVEILFFGDMLISYGDFFNRAHVLVPPGYCEEWWVQELEKAAVDMFGALDLDKMAEHVELPKVFFERLLKDPLETKVGLEEGVTLSKKFNVPLHPAYTYYWSTLSKDQLSLFLNWLYNMKINTPKEGLEIELPLQQNSKRILEILGVPHQVNGKRVIISYPQSEALFVSLSIRGANSLDKLKDLLTKEQDVLTFINQVSSVKIRDKSGVFIGARMGRPEKAKMRKLKGSPQVLFPVGEEGGRLRSFQSALKVGTITGDFPVYECSKCSSTTIYAVCENCGKHTQRKYFCDQCGEINKPSCQHGIAKPFSTQTINIQHYFDRTLQKLKTKHFPDLIKGVRGTSNRDHTPESLMKGILRARHNIYVNKDGTTRYDITQTPLTHFKPKEVGVDISKLRILGYDKDIEGKELVDKNQVLELLPQDLILPACDESPDPGADEVLFSVGKFIDDALVNLYDMDPYYRFKTKDDLIGQLTLVIAPHTSAGIVGRIIGFSQTQGLFAHPILHAATRRDCDGDESCVILLLDALINFSRKFLPAHRGATQDAPLVLTSRLIPAEVDDMVFDLDIAWRYPLEFYNACLEYKYPWDVKIEQVSGRINNEHPYQGMGFTHKTSNINDGVRCSAYKTLPSMKDKLAGQMELAEKIRAVKTSHVAELVISKHFIKDIKGNLRKFSTQQFRCVKCNEKFRRPPLLGKCTSCSGRIIFTISEGSVVKYLHISIDMAEKYGLSLYLKQTLELTKRRIESVFGKDPEKQEGLSKWVSP
jgi:DNA polymerase II large subunit